MTVNLTLFSCIRYVRSFLPALFLVFALQPLKAQVKPTPANERWNSLSQRKAMEEKSLLKDVSFRNIGPTIMSGRVDDLEVNPADPSEFYVAYATGGLWHTTNNGQSFVPDFRQ